MTNDRNMGNIETANQSNLVSAHGIFNKIGKVIAYMDMGVSLEEIAVKLNVTLGEVKQTIHQCPD